MRGVVATVFVIGGGGAGLAAVGCSTGPTCGGGDPDCVLTHLTVTIPGFSGTLTPIGAGTVQPSQRVPGKGAPALTDNLGAPSLCFSPTDNLVGLPFQFTDPNGARPGGCFSVRRSGDPLGDFGTTTLAAFPSVADGATSGRLSVLIGPGFSVDDPIDVIVDLYPVAPASPGQEAIQQLVAGGPIVVGAPVSIPTHVLPGGSCYGNSGGSCPDGHPCSGSDHICCKQADGSYSCLLPGLCQ
jgi:hypothetical protein